MKSRLLAVLGMITIITVIASLPVSGQGSGAAAPPLVITAFNGGPSPANWTPPKTPWGEPDLQGTWSSDDATFPVSRPQPGAGRGGAGRGAAPAAQAQAAQAPAEPVGLYLNDE